MTDEYNALINNSTWTLVPRPSDTDIVRSMWLIKHKFNADGNLSRYKARLVANGRNQLVGIDCDETFDPVVKPASIRTVTIAILHALRDTRVYIQIRPVLIHPLQPHFGPADFTPKLYSKLYLRIIFVKKMRPRGVFGVTSWSLSLWTELVAGAYFSSWKLELIF
ncbi:uncharacterized mitochondrial protein AtMg00820-like [Rutidosis leptorrhynchoides]|uniref:uncharacterized mitochondrial protein AtMg00820-like n=1 Tax=Rutidosis leptorrhynchoides TaxID=125765 RepID=UPI003A995C2B